MRRKFLPTKEELKQHKWLGFLHKYMHHNFLWHFDRNSVTKACIVGGFMCMMPIPFQMVPAAILALTLRANLIITIALVWISNPITMLPMMYGAYLFGCFMMGQTALFYEDNFAWHHIITNIHAIFVPLILGCIIIGLAFGLLLSSIVWLSFNLWRKFKNH
ncbi:DUF2062 domain-containing protein [Fastidiosibacter lacustris]|uniref:DUF2062 domain-containing protein n=1 Tax=Fastidiosibacter lacustris TaxID=2056695 RepID=UPI0013009E33|nr:DUF2062 domain-containing protein [Fastidiosibacter lacustris]